MVPVTLKPTFSNSLQHRKYLLYRAVLKLSLSLESLAAALASLLWLISQTQLNPKFPRKPLLSRVSQTYTSHTLLWTWAFTRGSYSSKFTFHHIMLSEHGSHLDSSSPGHSCLLFLKTTHLHRGTSGHL